MWEYQNKKADEPKHNSFFDAKRADKTIKLCTKCDKCWEIDIASTTSYMKRVKKIYYVYYKDFPSYGKPVEVCPKCKNQ